MPAALSTPRQAGNAGFSWFAPIMNDDSTELFVAREQLIEWLELTERSWLKRLTQVFVDKKV
jgi:hypothetical protein